MLTNEAAEILGITKRSAARLCRLGIIEAVKHGRDYWVEASEVERYKVERRKRGRPMNVAANVAGEVSQDTTTAS